MADKIIQMQSSDGLNNLNPIGAMPYIDSDNVIAQVDSNSSIKTYTATVDCLFVGGGYCTCLYNYGPFYNGKDLLPQCNSVNGYSSVLTIPLKAGDTIQIFANNNNPSSYKVYGVKY